MDRLEELLQQIGFSKYEISLLTYLYQHWSATAESLAQNTGIPKTRVYDTMDQLVIKGFASVSTGRPRVFQAQSPSVAAQNFLKRKKEQVAKEINQLENILQEFVQISQPIFLQSSSTISPDELLFQYSSLEDIEEKTRELLISAKEEICILTNIFNWIEKVRPQLVSALQRGVSVRVIMQQKTKNKSIEYLQKKFQNFKIKFTSSKNKLRGTIKDKSEVVFVIWAVEPSNGGEGEKKIFRPQFSSNYGLVVVFQNNFEYLWNI